MIRCRLLIKGHIQGVGYRGLIQQVARKLDINGLVRNLNDGSVEIFCEVENKSILKKFKEIIDKKSDEKDYFNPNVNKISEFYDGEDDYAINPPKEFKRFEIDYGFNLDDAEKEMLERLEIGTLGLSNLNQNMTGCFNDLGNKYHTISYTMFFQTIILVIILVVLVVGLLTFLGNISKWWTPERRAKAKREKRSRLKKELRKLKRRKWNPKLAKRVEKLENAIEKINDSLGA